MPQFYWTGRTQNRQTVSGTMESTSKEAVVSALRAKHVTVTSIAQGASAARPAAGALRASSWASPSWPARR